MFPWIYKHILTLIILSPVFGILFLTLIPRRDEEASSEVAVASSGLTLFLTIIMFSFAVFDERFIFTENYEWLPHTGTMVRLGVDGLSSALICVTAFLIFFSVLINWKRPELFRKEGYVALMMFEMCLIGFFASIDILVMYIFMELSIIFLGLVLFFFRGVGSGGLGRFVGFMSVSGILALVVVIYLMLAAGTSELVAVEKVFLSKNFQIAVFSTLFIFALMRMGLFPFNGWMDGIGKARFNAMILTIGLSLIGGGYFFYRLVVPFVSAMVYLNTIVLWIVTISIAISALMLVSRRSFSSIVINSAVVQFGFILLGIISVNQQGFSGAGMQMVAVAIVFTALSLIGELLRRRGLDVDVEEAEFKVGSSPLFRAGFFVSLLALSGAPGFLLFPGLFLIWMGLFKSSWVLAMVSILSVVVLAASTVRFASIFLNKDSALGERDWRRFNMEAILIVPAILILFAIGFFPDIILVFVKQSTEATWKIISHQM